MNGTPLEVSDSCIYKKSPASLQGF